MKLTSLLSQIYEPFGNEWVKQNTFVFDVARKTGITLAGSIAIAVARKEAIKPPGDIDFVCHSPNEAQHFINALQDHLLTKSVYWKAQVNSRTDFCPKGCTAHFRFTAPFWLPICVMVIGDVKHWRITGGNFIQDFNDVIQSAKDLELRDGKDRTSHLEIPDDDRTPVHISIDLSKADPLAISLLGSLQGFPYPSAR